MSIDLQFHKWIVLLVLAGLVILLIKGKYTPSYLFIGAAGILVVLKILPMTVLVGGLANTQILTVFLVIMVSAIVQKNFNPYQLFDYFLGKAKTPKTFLVRMNAIVAGLSSVFNNTPIVVMMMPYVYEKAKEYKISPSKLLMPLSFSAILGGMITLIGTSTNLVLNGLLESNNVKLLSFMDFFIPGILVTVVGIIYLYFFGYHRLENKSLMMDEIGHGVRSYFIETKLTPSSQYIGQSIHQLGIRDRKGVNPIEIIRGEEVINVVLSTAVRLEANDRIIFSGSIDDILELLEENTDLVIAKNPRFQLNDSLKLLEVSIPANSPLEDVKVKDANFRKTYNSTIIAVHRNGEMLSGRLGEIELKRGDVLLITTSELISIAQLKKDFYILSHTNYEEIKSNEYAKYFLALTLGFLGMAFGQIISLFTALLLTVFLAVILKLITPRLLRQTVDLHLLSIMVTALALGDLFIRSGASKLITQNMMLLLEPTGTLGVLIGIMLLTVFLTSFITNVAAVSVAFPLAYSVSEQLGVDGEVFYLGIAFAASAAFITPIGYQTNMIVSGPGGYTTKDFLKVGSPMLLLYFTTVIVYLTIRYQII
ncbi:SLC13 family permease [Algivirga pacifica]|uniref:SLC13 family permease n=1 Tax=Algivirga pacifica TaxID=1162670 RepID=A0ABP9D6H5_9BACT